MQVMRCFACSRPLVRSAVPGLHIGPKCAKDRALTVKQDTAARVPPSKPSAYDSRQVDWVNFVKSTKGAESADA